MSILRFLVFIFLLTQSSCIFSEEEEEIKPALTVDIPMRDGYLLPTDIYLPDSEAKGLPCILLRSPAGRKTHWKGFAKMSKAGYVVAIQDTRNVLDLEGKTFPFLSDGWGKLQDGYDTIAWLAKSPYTNGKIGTWGSSALGITQLLLAPTKPPGLECQYIVVAAGSLYHHALFPGGQLLKNQAENWLGYYAHDTGIISYICQRPFYNEFWKQLDATKMAHQVTVPAIHIAGWYDTFLQGTIDAFTSKQFGGGPGAKGKQKLVIGPWTHFWPVSKHFGDFEVPVEGVDPPYDISPKRWFDHFLKGEDNGIDKMPSIIYYVMGPFDGAPSSGNRWRISEVWPIPAQETVLYFTPDWGLQEKDTFEGLLSYLYDPRNVTPTKGGRNLFLESGPKDQSEIEEREDVLFFTTTPVTEDIEVTGNVKVKLYFGTNQPDTDIVVRLTDVYPDGRSILINDAAYRLGVMCYNNLNLSKSDLSDAYVPIKIEENKPLEVDIDLGPVSIVFAKGHSVGVSITSSNYPKYEKNMNIGLLGTFSGIFNLAKNTVFMGPRYPSQLILPIVRKGSVWLKQPQEEAPKLNKGK